MTDAELTVLTDKITAAENAYHSLMVGTMARVFVDQNGERVEFTATNRSQLYAYIAELKSLLPSASGGTPRYGRPIRYLF